MFSLRRSNLIEAVRVNVQSERDASNHVTDATASIGRPDDHRFTVRLISTYRFFQPTLALVATNQLIVPLTWHCSKHVPCTGILIQAKCPIRILIFIYLFIFFIPLKEELKRVGIKITFLMNMSFIEELVNVTHGHVLHILIKFWPIYENCPNFMTLKNGKKLFIKINET